MSAAISIIVPNYNHAEFLNQRMKSIFNQSFTDFELYFLDDASTDQSLKVIQEFKADPRFKQIVTNQTNSGSAFHQWKKGAELATSEWIWIAESDDYCEPELLQRLMDFASKNPCDLVYAQTIDVDENGKSILNRITSTASFKENIWEKDFCVSGHDFLANYLKNKNVIPNASAVIVKRKALLSAMNRIHDLENMKHAGDWWLWIMIAEVSSIGFVATPLNYFRNHSRVSRNHDSLQKLYNRLLEEKQIRIYLDRHASYVNQKLEWYNLSETSFSIVKDISPLRKKFFEFKPPFESRWNFYKRFKQYLQRKK